MVEDGGGGREVGFWESELVVVMCGLVFGSFEWIGVVVDG